MPRILITGGGGFIGSHLAKTLFNQGNYVRVADVKYDGYQPEPYCSEQYTLDLRHPENCLMATEGIDQVYNLAANMGGIGYISNVAADIMHDNTLINIYMLEAAHQNKVESYLYSSSACIYPTTKQTDPDNAGLKEQDAYPAEPDSYYGWEKLYSEKLCEAYQKDHGINIHVLRYHNVYGPQGTYRGGREKSIAALCRKTAEANNPDTVEIWGDGQQTRSYCYIDDAVKATISLMNSEYSKPLNIGSDRLISIDELADIIIKLSGKQLSKTYVYSAPQGVRGRNADLTLVQQVLGWIPLTSLEEGLAETYCWINNQIHS